MSATIVYKQETVGHHIECECGYVSEYHDYQYGDYGEDVAEPWTCPKCGKTFDLEEEFL